MHTHNKYIEYQNFSYFLQEFLNITQEFNMPFFFFFLQQTRLTKLSVPLYSEVVVL